MSFSVPNMKLGKRAARKDPRTLRLAKYIKALPPAPPRMGYLDAVRSWPMALNDAIGDCVVAAMAHMVQQWTTYAKPAPFVPTDQQVLQAYMTISGYNPNDPLTDQGCVMLDALNYWRKHGLGEHEIMAYVAINPTRKEEVEHAIALFGNCFVGFGLPVSAQAPRNDLGGLPLWEVPASGAVGDGSFGSWGGHAVPLVGYNNTDQDRLGVRLVSWGGLYDATWHFVAEYCDEAYAVLSRDWIERSGVSPSGFDLATLLADLAEVAG
jgi:hypothetical protein